MHEIAVFNQIFYNSILSAKLLNQGFLKNRVVFQKVFRNISKPCWNVLCQLHTDDERLYWQL